MTNTIQAKFMPARLNDIYNEFNETIKSHLPKNWLIEPGQTGAGCRGYLREENNAYEGSEYLYNGERSFVHWTNLRNLVSIINSRQIRLYDLHRSDDAEEFKYGADLLSIPNHKIDHSKKFIYTLSFCEGKHIDNHDMWVEYGQNYEGIALEFEIVNNPAEWHNFMISEVHYELPKKLRSLIDSLEALKQKHPDSIYEFDLGRLIAFHKLPKFNKENEIRLATYFPNKELDAHLKYCNYELIPDSKRPRITSYYGLHLFVDNNSPELESDKPEYNRRLVVPDDYFKIMPKIKIKNIRFGKNCGLTNHQYNDFKEKIEEMVKTKLGYSIELPLNL